MIRNLVITATLLACSMISHPLAGTEVIIVKGFDPGTEYDADEGGRSLAVVTGYAPGGLRSVLVSIDELDDQSNEVFSTHPSNEKRLKRLPDDPPPPVADEDAVALN